jgi:uncharacterized phage-associated protein
MAVHPLIAAKKVCELRTWGVSNLEINKILYFAHMLFLGRHGLGSPLVDEMFQAWDYGPVLPSVYHRTKAFGRKPVQNVFYWIPDLPKGGESGIIEEAVDELAGKSPAELVAITHWEDGAWARHYEPGARGIVIPNKDILYEYNLRVK